MATLTIWGWTTTPGSAADPRSENGRSMEEEVRVTLRASVSDSQVPAKLGTRIQARFAALGGVDLEFFARRWPPATSRTSRTPACSSSIRGGILTSEAARLTFGAVGTSARYDSDHHDEDAQRTEFTVPLHMGGTDFQRAVWQALRTIPYGETWSYARLAAAIGRGPDRIRAVGSANGRNSLSIVVPCHRVIGREGSLTGYGGGLDRERFLLDLEQRHTHAAFRSMLTIGSMTPRGQAVVRAVQNGRSMEEKVSLIPRRPGPT